MEDKVAPFTLTVESPEVFFFELPDAAPAT